MARPRKLIPSYRRHKASGQAYVELNGRIFYLGRYNTQASRDEYDRLIGEWLQQGRQIPPGQHGEGTTIVELVSAYRQYAKRYYRKDGRPTSEVTVIKYALRYVRRLYGRRPISEFGPIALQSVRQRMVDDGLARSTVNQHVSRIKRMFKWGTGQELVSGSVYHALNAVSGLHKGRCDARESEPVLPVAESVVDATLPHLPEVVGDMVRVHRLTGMRPTEICTLRPIDLDRSSDIWIYRPVTHKTEHHGRDRVIFIGPQAQAILFRYLARDPGTYCFRPEDSETKRRLQAHAARKTPLSCGTKPGGQRKQNPKRGPGSRYDVCSYRRAIHRACDKAFPAPEPLAQRPKETERAWNGRLTESQQKALAEWQSKHRWSPNQLRHAAATEIRKQFGLEAAQVLLGHATANVTQIYAERDLAKGIEVARRIG